MNCTKRTMSTCKITGCLVSKVSFVCLFVFVVVVVWRGGGCFDNWWTMKAAFKCIQRYIEVQYKGSFWRISGGGGGVEEIEMRRRMWMSVSYIYLLWWFCYLYQGKIRMQYIYIVIVSDWSWLHPKMVQNTRRQKWAERSVV